MTNELLPDTWSWREYPVLVEAARLLEAKVFADVRFQALQDATGLSDTQVYQAACALRDAGLISVHLVMPWHRGSVTTISPEARRLVGLWPTPESALDRMITALEAIAANTDDEDTRTRVRKILDGLGGAGRTIGISVAAAAIGGRLPGQ